MLSDIVYRLRALFRRSVVEAELDEELRQHLEHEAAKYQRAGMPAEQALRRARMALGGPEQVREQCRDERRTRWLEDSIRDLHYGIRTLRKSPLFSATAAITIALGIAACTVIFSVVNAVLLRPLPYVNAERLLLSNTLVSNADFFDLRAGVPALEDSTALMVYRAVVPREDGSAERISKGLVMPNFMRMLGVRIALGRDFTEADAQPPASGLEPVFPPPQGTVAILSYDYWQRRYGGNPAVIGQEMPATGGRGPRIIGVMQQGFRLLLPGPMGPSPDVLVANHRGYDDKNRGALMLQVIAALRNGATVERAQAQVDSVAARWQTPAGFHLRFAPWHQTLVAEVRPAIVVLMGAVVFLSLIASANVTNLLLVRAGLRARELAVRAAIGARRGRLMRQMLAEALLLSIAGTAIGVLLAWVGLRRLIVFAPSNIPRLDMVAIDWRVLAFAALAGLAEAAVFGIVPAWRASRPDVIEALRGLGRTAGSASGCWLRNGVVIAEVALSFVLLIAGGLMFRSFVELLHINPGYDPHHLLTFLAVGDAASFGQPQKRLAFLSNIREHLSSIPGVESVCGSPFIPLKRAVKFGTLQWGTEQARTDPSRMQAADIQYVLPGYFETLRTPLIEGRLFTEKDNAPRRNVAVIDRLIAERGFPNQSAVGRRIFVPAADPQILEVIGVVEHQRFSLTEAGAGQIYFTDGFWGIGISRNWALRTEGDPASYAAVARAEIARAAPGRLAVTEMQTMDSMVVQSQSGTRFHLLLISIFAGIAVLLAAVGLYGVLASVVRQRTSEIAVRIAIGAAPGSIFRLVVGQGIRLSVLGIIIGTGAALALTRAMTTMLVGIKPADPFTFATVATVFLLIASLACWIPARRAASVDPTLGLREE